MVLWRWKRIGRDVRLGAGRPWIKVTPTGRVVLVRVLLWRAAPNWRAVCGWHNIGPWRDWRGSAIRVSPNRQRNWCVGIQRGGRWAWNDDDPRWCSGWRRSHSSRAGASRARNTQAAGRRLRCNRADVSHGPRIGQSKSPSHLSCVQRRRCRRTPSTAISDQPQHDKSCLPASPALNGEQSKRLRKPSRTHPPRRARSAQTAIIGINRNAGSALIWRVTS
jgi:hypothetical protein